MTYEKAAELWASARHAESGKPLGNNTRLFKRGADFAVQLHATDVVTIRPGGTYTLRTGGWETVTTKARINEYAPVRLGQSKGLWYLHPPYSENGEPVLFENGVTVGADGMPIYYLNGTPDMADTEKRKRKVDRLVSAYIKGFAQAVTDGQITEPSGGDCWGCYFATGECKPPVERGHEVMGFDHYMGHFEQGYYVPSLLWRAIKERGYGDPALIWHMAVVAKNGRMAADNLRPFFTRRKLALIKELN